MKKKVSYILLMIGITLSTNSCAAIDYVGLSDLFNALAAFRAVNFVINNAPGLLAVGIITAGFHFLKSGRHKQFRLWLSRSIAFFVVMATIVMSLLFYIQYHEFFIGIFT